MHISFDLEDFNALLGNMSIPNSIVKTEQPDDIVITLWKGSKKFKYTFHYDGDGTDGYYLGEVEEL